MKTELLPMTKARKSVREVTAMVVVVITMIKYSPAYREKLVTLMKTEVVPMTKARKSVREVMVMPIPALARVLPKIFGTC